MSSIYSYCINTLLLQENILIVITQSYCKHIFVLQAHILMSSIYSYCKFIFLLKAVVLFWKASFCIILKYKLLYNSDIQASMLYCKVIFRIASPWPSLQAATGHNPLELQAEHNYCKACRRIIQQKLSTRIKLPLSSRPILFDLLPGRLV